MYPDYLVAPMKEDLTIAGFQELTNAEEVEALLNKKEGTVFVVVNSVCGCAAANARPAAKIAVNNSKKPDNTVTVFAGVDKEAVAKVREFTAPYPPSSPSMALFKDGKLVHFIERLQIEGKPAEMIAENLKAAFDTYC
ncbi:MAG: BrxA/BrxB family bacilliredoxin [Chitinophagaceae bacterium]|nr:MAG: BrxA/BrxB family bacilliredoxin [Chitinophagaceae bacterium]